MLKGNRLAGRIDEMKTRTRMDKWKKYRAKIRSLPEGAFEEKKENAISFSKVDRDRLEGSLSPSYEPRLQTTPYKAFLAKKRRNFPIYFILPARMLSKTRATFTTAAKAR